MRDILLNCIAGDIAVSLILFAGSCYLFETDMLTGVGIAATLLADPPFNVGTLDNRFYVGIVML